MGDLVDSVRLGRSGGANRANGRPGDEWTGFFALADAASAWRWFRERIMSDPAFKVWRVLEEREVADEQGHKYRTITKKEFVGEIVNPKEEVYVTWMELAERFGEGYYLVDVPSEIRQRHVVPAEQRVKTPGAF